MQLDKKSAKTLLWVICAAIVFYLGLKHVGSVLDTAGSFLSYFSPLVTGFCIAFILNIPMCGIERLLWRVAPKSEKRPRKWIRPVSIVVTLLLFLGAIALVMFIVIPEMISTIKSLSGMTASFIKRIEAWTSELSVQMPYIVEQLESLGLDLGALSKQFLAVLQDAGLSIVNSSLTAVTGVFTGLFQFFLGLVFSFYVLFNKEKLGSQARRLLEAYAPKKIFDRVATLCSVTHKTFTSFFTGQFVEALILGAMFLVGMTIFRFPYAMLVSVLVAFTALIPIFGAFIGCAVGTFLILVVSPVRAFWFLVFFLVVQQLEGNLIYPKVVGSSVGLPALWVLAAVTVGGSMFGILGMLLFIPTFSVVYRLLRESVGHRLSKKNPEPEKSPESPAS